MSNFEWRRVFACVCVYTYVYPRRYVYICVYDIIIICITLFGWSWGEVRSAYAQFLHITARPRVRRRRIASLGCGKRVRVGRVGRRVCVRCRFIRRYYIMYTYYIYTSRRLKVVPLYASALKLGRTSRPHTPLTRRYI